MTVTLAAIFFANSPLAARRQKSLHTSRISTILPVLSAWIVMASGLFTLCRAVLL